MRIIWLATLFVGCIEYETLSDVDNGDLGIDEDSPPFADEDLPPGWAGDAWDLPADADKLDIIFYGDTSTSMTEELVTLGDHVTDYVDRLSQFVPDWQIATITGNTGCAVNGILGPNTPEYSKEFAQAIVTPPADTNEDEMGLQNVAIAVEQSRTGGCNEGLLRGGMLSIVFISDENDESPGFDVATDYWRDYLDRIVAVTGDEFGVVISAVAGPAPGGCEGADAGWGYNEAVDGTAGEFLSICDNWEDQLDTLADAAVIRDTFVLSEPAVEDTIIVWLNNAQVDTQDWVYIPGQNAVFLTEPALPGDRVDIAYEVL